MALGGRLSSKKMVSLLAMLCAVLGAVYVFGGNQYFGGAAATQWVESSKCPRIQGVPFCYPMTWAVSQNDTDIILLSPDTDEGTRAMFTVTLNPKYTTQTKEKQLERISGIEEACDFDKTEHTTTATGQTQISMNAFRESLAKCSLAGVARWPNDSIRGYGEVQPVYGSEGAPVLARNRSSGSYGLSFVLERKVVLFPITPDLVNGGYIEITYTMFSDHAQSKNFSKPFTAVFSEFVRRADRG
jgi:hypothetical protein